MAAHFFGYWAAAFVTLCLGLALPSVFYGLIDSELGLHTLGKEAVLLAFGIGLSIIASLAKTL